MPKPQSDLAMAWQVRQARSKGFRALVRKEVPPLADEAAEPVEQHSELSASADPAVDAEPAPADTAAPAETTPQPRASRLKEIVSRVRREGL